MLEVRMTMTGTRSLLMHNVRLADPLDPIARAMKVLTGKRNKTDEDYEELARLEYLGGLYIDERAGPYLPGESVWASLLEGGRMSRGDGKLVERGVLIPTAGLINPLQYANGPRTAEELVANANFRLVKAVGVNRGKKIMRTRPCFRRWACEVPIELDSAIIDLDRFVAIAERAGMYCGIGDFRRMYGRYGVELEKVG